MRCGLDLRDLGDALSYRRLSVFLAGSPEDSSFARSSGGDESLWTLTDQLLALIADQLAAANWQRGGGVGPRPKPIPRPGVVDSDDKTFKGVSMTLEEAEVWAKKAAGRE